MNNNNEEQFELTPIIEEPMNDEVLHEGEQFASGDEEINSDEC